VPRCNQPPVSDSQNQRQLQWALRFRLSDQPLGRRLYNLGQGSVPRPSRRCRLDATKQYQLYLRPRRREESKQRIGWLKSSYVTQAWDGSTREQQRNGSIKVISSGLSLMVTSHRNVDALFDVGLDPQLWSGH